MTLLTAPRIPIGSLSPRLPDPALLDDLVPGSGAGIIQAKDAHREVVRLVDDLTARRPGGPLWRDAMTQDAANFTAGTWPKKSATETLLAGDEARWAKASAAARTIAARVSRMLSEVRATPGLLEAAQAAEQAAMVALVVDAQTAYEFAATGKSEDRPRAWAAYSAALAGRDRCALMRGVQGWIAEGGTFDPKGYGPGWSAEVAGYVLAAEALLEGRKYLALPKGVKFPRGFRAGDGMVGPDVSTALLTAGVAEVPGS